MYIMLEIQFQSTSLAKVNFTMEFEKCQQTIVPLILGSQQADQHTMYSLPY